MSLVDHSHPAASYFLWIASPLFTVAFALPLLLKPIAWARAMRWQVAQADDLTLYLGRCVGGLALAITGCCLRAASEPARHPLVFELIAAVGVLMTGIHIVGALRRQQPWTETAEIALYAALAGAAIWWRITLR